jgi:MFS superfamily sulfate permease-like transporter
MTLASSSRLAPDIGAGLCVAGLLLPEAVAYAGLAHLPVTQALTATLIGLSIYGLLGSSRFAVVAPTSSSATLSAAAALSITGTVAGAGFAAYSQVLLALVLLAGGLLMLLGLARQGQLSSFISRPVLRGFAFALALTIVVKQLPDALGYELPTALGTDPLSVLAFTLAHPANWHAASAIIALLSALLLVLLKPWPRLPGAMLLIVLAIAASAWLDLPAMGVHAVGLIEQPSMRWGWPDLPLSEWTRAAELAFGLVMLVFAESWGSMRTMALPHGDTLDPNRELMVLGACNVASALMQGMAVGAGFSATSANAAAGAVSRKAAWVALAVIIMTLLFALPALRWLPRPVLAVAVVNALWHALSLQPILTIWRMNRDRLLVLGAALVVLLFGVLNGMLAAIALSLLAALQRFSQPVLHELGELGSSRNFVDVHTQQGAAVVPGLLILRPEEPLFFGSAERVVAEVMARLPQRHDLTTVVLSLEESADLDSTAVECLMELRQSLQRQGLTLLLARVKTTVRDLLTRWDPDGLAGQDRMFWSVADAVAHFRSARTLPQEPNQSTSGD